MSSELDFVESLIRQGVLRFGDFTLKSGKQSPYFLNLGNIDSGEGLRELGRFFTACILSNDLRPDVLFGPAYKGIPFVVTTAVAMVERGLEIDIAFNRKESKGYGEGGSLIGADMAGKRVVMLDDVVMDGATKIEAAEIVKQAGGQLCGIVIGVDRQEFVAEDLTASESVAEELGVGVYSVATITHALEFLKQSNTDADQVRIMSDYITENCRLSD